jgi:hypothetical protein
VPAVWVSVIVAAALGLVTLAALVAVRSLQAASLDVHHARAGAVAVQAAARRVVLEARFTGRHVERSAGGGPRRR